MRTVVLALVCLLFAPALPGPEPLRTEMIEVGGNTFAAINSREILADEIHLGVAAWVARCMGVSEPALRIAGWRVAEVIVGISPNVRGWQPLAITRMNEDRTATVVFRREWAHVNFVISHELIHVASGIGDDDPVFEDLAMRCQVRLPLNFGPLPVIAEDSIAKLEALVR